MTDTPGIDDQTIALITERVVAALRDEIEEIVMSLAAATGSDPLTVGEVAERFSVARSTVYAHWREWGGYKLGAGDRAAIRFALNALPARPTDHSTAPVAKPAVTRRERPGRRVRAVLPGKPRLSSEFDGDPAQSTPQPRPTRPQSL